MLFNLRAVLFLSAIAYLGLCDYGFALNGVTDPATTVSEKKSLHRPSLLTMEEIIDAYNAGEQAGSTHMIVVWDTWDFENSYNFVDYSYPGNNVSDLINSYDAPGYYRVTAVFAMHLDINQQLSEKRWYPEYP